MLSTADLARKLAELRETPARVVALEGGCNNRCAFCPASGRSPEPLAPDALAATDPTSDRLVVAGAEPTLRDELPALLRRARTEGFRDIRIWTNGRRLAYAPYARHLVRSGLSGAVVLMPGADAATYGAATGVPEGFEQAHAGLANLAAAGLDPGTLELFVPVTPTNADNLAAVAALAAGLGVGGVVAAPTDEAIAASADLGTLRDALDAQDLPFTWLGPRGSTRPAPPEADVPPAPGIRIPPVTWSTIEVGTNGMELTYEAVVYLTFRCDADCRYCPLDHTQPPPADPAAQIRTAAERGVLSICITGGEPALAPELPELLALAHDLGIPERKLLTNGIRLAHRPLVDELATAGLNFAVVSLPGSDAAVVDDLMRRRGAFEAILAGIANLIDAGIPTIVHHVISRPSLPGLPQLPGLLQERFGDVAVGFSYAAPLDERSETDELIPSFEEAIPVLRGVLDDCARRGLPYGFLDCLNGMAPCLMPEHADRFGCILAPSVQRMTTCADQFVRPEACEICEWGGACSGVRSGYATLHGLEAVMAAAARLRRER